MNKWGTLNGEILSEQTINSYLQSSAKWNVSLIELLMHIDTHTQTPLLTYKHTTHKGKGDHHK